MKNIIIAAISSIFFAFSGISDNQVWIHANFPSSVYSGDQFTVEITINKMSLKHFAEFRQKLPKGFTAVERVSQSADFHFSNQFVKLVWLRLPRQAQFKVSYDILVDSSVKGVFKLPGQFTYIYNNQRGNVYLNNLQITVHPRGQSLDFNKEIRSGNIQFPPTDSNLVQCLRIKPFYSKDQQSIIVKLLVSRGVVNSAAKIEEQIPVGYRASLIESGNASFSFDRQKVEFIWNKLPIKKNFEISYKLSPISFNPQLPKINGSFMYLGGGQIQSSKIIELDINQKRNNANTNINNDDILNFFNDSPQNN
ncbi:MAG: hypothetical protein DRJ10_15935 [Bacteroidetes bacterium]|nr:MAG: hypothetical protein DRJ10_15935 [Bacteroidota bacterium]